MARVTVQLPSMLSQVTGVASSVSIEATSLRAALDALTTHHPAIQTHLFDETGGFRPHVLCYHNDANTRWLPGLDGPLSDGDTITIVQAVSGG